MEVVFEHKGSYKDKEIRTVISYYFLKKNNMQICFSILGVGVVTMLILALINKTSVEFLLCCIFAVFLVVYLCYIRPVNSYLKVYRASEGVIYKFYDEKIAAEGEEIQSIISWNIYKKAYETKDAFLLLGKNKFFYIFHKDYFHDIDGVTNMRKLLESQFENFQQLK